MSASLRTRFLSLVALVLTALPAAAQSTSEFRTACDSMAARLCRRTSVQSKVALRSIARSGDVLDFRFTKELSDYPWQPADTAWFKEEFRSLFPKKYAACTVGLVYADVKTQAFPALVVPALSSSGRPGADYAFRRDDPRGEVRPLVEQIGGVEAPRGLSGRHIALWQSHGRYFEQRTQRWEWQRAPTFRTCEDLFTQGFVLPFLLPMLENAGAVVLTPRERDVQPWECVVDNDPAFRERRTGMLRRSGMYAEEGRWEDGGTGFADAKAVYSGLESPFGMGTFRKARTVTEGSSDEAVAQWTADLPERGRYAVYVSYASLPTSTDAAHYTVHHLGGTSEFLVNQRIGGGMWVYLGTFEFPEGSAGYVTLDNVAPGWRKFRRGEVVTADAVRFGGGMGKVARGGAPAGATAGAGSAMGAGSDGDLPSVSGYPAYLEGALYAMQYGGMPTAVLYENELDYTNDYAKRGAWVSELSGGSAVNPTAKGRGIPFDLSLAFHTDAGVTPSDSTVGTLAIYTLLCDNKPELADGSPRQQCRDFAALVQDQVVSDIRAAVDSHWSRRYLWNRSYSECRTTGVPGMILELLSHQNFADMRYGLDPSFRFLVSRAVYKGVLKFLAERYGCRYTVQPLPVSNFSVTIEGDEAVLRWSPTADPLEPTAFPTAYRVETREDTGAFDPGVLVSGTGAAGSGAGGASGSTGAAGGASGAAGAGVSRTVANGVADSATGGAGANGGANAAGYVTARMSLVPGHLYSFRVIALNDGGASFPSEVLCAGLPAGDGKRPSSAGTDRRSAGVDRRSTENGRPSIESRQMMDDLAENAWPSTESRQMVDGTAGNASRSAEPDRPTSGASRGAREVLVVNNFTRVSAPAWFDTETYAGFDGGTDSGVAYGDDITFAGEQFGFRRQEPWLDDDCPGFGGSYIDAAGSVIPGNTFDLTASHARALLEAGYHVSSTSVAAFCADSTLRRNAFAIDLLCGKQVTTRVGAGHEQPDRFTVFPAPLTDALTAAARAGVHLLVSGARIGTDVWSGIYGDSIGTYDDTGRPAAGFVTGVLGYRWHSDRATRSFDTRRFAGAPLVPDPPAPSSRRGADSDASSQRGTFGSGAVDSGAVSSQRGTFGSGAVDSGAVSSQRGTFGSGAVDSGAVSSQRGAFGSGAVDSGAVSSQRDNAQKAAPPVPDYPTLVLPATHIGRTDRYPVEQVDGLSPAAEGARAVLRYADTNIDAAIAFAGGLSWTVAPGGSGGGSRGGSNAQASSGSVRSGGSSSGSSHGSAAGAGSSSGSTGSASAGSRGSDSNASGSVRSGGSSARTNSGSAGSGTGDGAAAWTCRYGAVSFGFPLEQLSDADLAATLRAVMDWFAALPKAEPDAAP